MRPRHSALLLAGILTLGALPLRASTIPVIQGNIAGVELCTQSTCGSAIFVAIFSGQVGVNPFALGVISTSINHEDLPDPGETAAITGGIWQLRLLNGRKFAGAVTGGTLFNNDDGTYDVTLQMSLLFGGTGDQSFEGTLSHNTFPPTIQGAVLQ